MRLATCEDRLSDLARKRLHFACALEAQGRYGEAPREAEAAREAAPEDLSALELFSRIAAEAGRLEEPIEAFEIAGRKPNAQACAYTGRVARLRERREAQRLRWLEKGITPTGGAVAPSWHRGDRRGRPALRVIARIIPRTGRRPTTPGLPLSRAPGITARGRTRAHSSCGRFGRGGSTK